MFEYFEVGYESSYVEIVRCLIIMQYSRYVRRHVHAGLNSEIIYICNGD